MRTHKVLTIAKRDYIATVRTKAFIFGLVVAPVLFGGGSIGMSFPVSYTHLDVYKRQP